MAAGRCPCLDSWKGNRRRQGSKRRQQWQGAAIVATVGRALTTVADAISEADGGGNLRSGRPREEKAELGSWCSPVLESAPAWPGSTETRHRSERTTVPPATVTGGALATAAEWGATKRFIGGQVASEVPAAVE